MISEDVPNIGPSPTLLSRKEVDALYVTFKEVIAALDRLNVDYIVTGGSLLGAIRQHSMLFCDDDIDIAIIEYDGHQYDRVALNLQDFLPENEFIYQIRPWEGGDRIRPRRMNNVFIDLFTLRCYNSEQELRDVIGIKKNGQLHPESYVQEIINELKMSAGVIGESPATTAGPLYPLWHFNTRKAVEMWPKEVYRQHELFPLDRSLEFGPLHNVAGPCMPVKLLKRAFGDDCFQVYYQSSSHQIQHPKPIKKQVKNSSNHLTPLTQTGGTWESGQPLVLKDEHFLPMQPLARSARRPTQHCRAALESYLKTKSQLEENLNNRVDVTVPQISVPRPRRAVYMDGVFDLFHVGHLEAIRHCARLGTRVIIGVTGDEDATGYKRAPIVNQKDRAALVQALSEVDKVICPCPLVPSTEFMFAHEIELVVHGFANDADAKRQEEFFGEARRAKRFQRIPYYSGLSTTDIIHKIHRLDTSKTGDLGSTDLRLNGKPQWFGTTIVEVTNHACFLPTDPFPILLRSAIEPHISKARSRRGKALAAIRKKTGANSFDAVVAAFRARGCVEGEFMFDTKQVKLRRSLLKIRGLPLDSKLEDIHQDSTMKNNLLKALTEDYTEFQNAYDEFVRGVCLPHLSEQTGSTSFYVQSFPCLRVLQPQEFSIGPHADVSYGHHPCSINVYVPLTPTGGTSALYLERSPGSEDWHPIEGDYGYVKHFGGSMCLHWTTENTTDKTRVSLDFRAIEGDLFDRLESAEGEDGGQRDVYRESKGYYTYYRVDNGEWISNEPPAAPDCRVGFPWTVTDWSKVKKTVPAK